LLHFQKFYIVAGPSIPWLTCHAQFACPAPSPGGGAIAGGLHPPGCPAREKTEPRGLRWAAAGPGGGRCWALAVQVFPKEDKVARHTRKVLLHRFLFNYFVMYLFEAEFGWSQNGDPPHLPPEGATTPGCVCFIFNY
jgi:hypothetical protein